MAVEITSASAMPPGWHAQPWFRLGGSRISYLAGLRLRIHHDVSKEGRFLVNRARTDERPIIVVLDRAGSLQKKPESRDPLECVAREQPFRA